MPTLTDFVQEVRRLAAADPTFTYSKPAHDGACHYFPTPGNPHGCIIGAAARNLGVDLDDPIYEGRTARGVLEEVLDFDFDFDRAGETYLTLLWLTDVQNAQDNGQTWGEAITHADDKAARLAAFFQGEAK